MVYLLSKILPALVFPVGFACWTGVAASILALSGRPRAAACASLSGVLLLYLASVGPVGNALLRGLEGRYPPRTDFAESPAIVLLGGAGRPRTPPRLYAETNDFGDRVAYAALLYRKGLAPRIVTTGGTLTLFTDVEQSEASINAEILETYFGVEPSAILLADESRNTREDALCVARKFAQLGLPKEIILVTSAAHMPRAAALFRKLGFMVQAAPGDFHSEAAGGFKPISLLPSEAALYGTWYALHEYIGYAAYRLLGWI